MKMHITRKDIYIFIIQVVVAAFIFLLPAATGYASSYNWETARATLWMTWSWLHISLVMYFLNFYVFAPFLMLRHRKKWFVIANIIVLIIAHSPHIFYDTNSLAPWMRAGYYSFLVVSILLEVLAIMGATTIRYLMRQQDLERQLREEKQKHTEAELEWLKNQLNPHFLFNTLNNISSLVQIDADLAQDSIAQLSDLLRYAMYETRHEKVPIQGEVEFMRNYIELMKLRCNDKTEVLTTFKVEQYIEIAPLLFISLIENAFKHGVSSNRPSKIDIHLEAEGDKLVFTCDNTNYPKDDADRSGSGIGLENTSRRLELMYHDAYKWEQTLNNDIYHVKITIKL